MAKKKRGRPLGYTKPLPRFLRNGVSNEVTVMKAWIARREYKHKPWTMDELWDRINKLWPTLTEDEREEIFQKAGGVKRK